MDVDLQHLLHHIVYDEEAEDDLTQAHKVVPSAHVANQTHRLELPGSHNATSGGKLHQ